MFGLRYTIAQQTNDWKCGLSSNLAIIRASLCSCFSSTADGLLHQRSEINRLQITIQYTHQINLQFGGAFPSLYAFFFRKNASNYSGGGGGGCQNMGWISFFPVKILSIACEQCVWFDFGFCVIMSTPKNCITHTNAATALSYPLFEKTKKKNMTHPSICVLRGLLFLPNWRNNEIRNLSMLLCFVLSRKPQTILCWSQTYK